MRSSGIIKIGFLPFYIKLYDDVDPSMRTPMETCMKTVVSMLESQGIEVLLADVCRIKPEFDTAAAMFKKADADAVVTMHLAYSPSLEAIDALMSLDVPIIVLDTTPDYDLTACMEYKNLITPNHGIHGVQDMCSLLRGRSRPFWIETGHFLHSDVLTRVGSLCRAAKAAKTFHSARVGTVGGSFKGMGDFYISPLDFKSRIGAEVVEFSKNDALKYLAAVEDAEIKVEQDYDKTRFEVQINNLEDYRLATKSGLALRKWVEAAGLTALTVNFLNLDESGLPKMPFAELSKAMMRGIGYAGEGDILTAGLVAALMAAWPNTSFTEMFCPDWKENIILLSHMGEMNLNLSSRRPFMTDCPFTYNCTGDTSAAYGTLKGGGAVLVNLAPMETGLSLIVTAVEMLDMGLEFGAYRKSMQGFFRPKLPLSEFLKAYSKAGGTHHSALVYGVCEDDIVAFGEMMGFKVTVI
jgi:L-arabinose isomerase